jgi:hypothetical protein
VALIETALAKCDREEQRWSEAYAVEVINLAELKAYRADIEARRQSLQAHRGSLQAELDLIGQAVAHVEVLVDYCARVRQRLQTFDHAEKRVAFEALDIHVSWIPGQPLKIEGSIPIGEIVNNPATWYSWPARLAGTPSPERSAGTSVSRPAIRWNGSR